MGLIVIHLCVSVPLASAGEFLAEDYLPLAPGNEWTYRVDGLSGIRSLVQDELEVVNGVPTYSILEIGGPFDQSSENFTNDANGLRTHAVFLADPIEGDFTSIFSPPLVLLGAEFDRGEVIQSSGTATLTLEGIGTGLLSYQATSHVIDIESVTVPLGTFEAVRVDSSLRLYGTFMGVPIDETESGSTWLAFGIGSVKETYSDGSISELEATNVPEPSAALASFSALATLLLIVAWRRPQAESGAFGPIRVRRVKWVGFRPFPEEVQPG